MNFPASPPDRFPPAYGKRFIIAPVYLDPMVGAGERLCVLAAVQGETGGHAVSLIVPEMAECLYGERAKGLLGFIEVLRESLSIHFAAGLSLTAWRPPIEGAFLGDCTEALADDVDMAVRLVARGRASLCTLAALGGVEADDQTPPKRDSALSAWVESVQDAAFQRDPRIQYALNRTIVLSGGDKVKLHYALGNRAINLGLVIPSRFVDRRNDAKIKLWNLAHMPRGFERLGMVLGVPRDDAPEMAEIRIQEKIAAGVEALRVQANESRIVLTTVHTAEEAADVLLERMAA